MEESFDIRSASLEPAKMGQHSVDKLCVHAVDTDVGLIYRAVMIRENSKLWEKPRNSAL